MSEKRMQWSGKVIVQLLIVVIIMPFSALLISWKWDWWQAWAYAVIFSVGFILSRIWASRRSPDILAERAKGLDHEEMAEWDRPLSAFLGVGGLLIPILAGLEHRFGNPGSFGSTTHYVMLALVLIGYFIGSWALAENRFFSGVVRIQKDRGHQVVSSGPYTLVRHPGYLGALLMFGASPILLDSLWATAIGVLLAIVIFIRTKREDDFLQENLDGYKAFTKSTRRRLIPWIW